MESPDETTSLISAGKVQATPVYNTDGESLGELYDVMIDKRSGRIAYARPSVQARSQHGVTRNTQTPCTNTTGLPRLGAFDRVG